MVRRNNTQERWKKAADSAISPQQCGSERDRLAAEVAKRVWVANGGREWADAREEGSLLALETLVVRHLHDGLVRSAAALRYLSVLEDNLRTADYEDARSLEAERRWAEEYLAGTGALPGAGEESRPGMQDAAGEQLERLRVGLTNTLMAELKAAAIAAA